MNLRCRQTLRDSPATADSYNHSCSYKQNCIYISTTHSQQTIQHPPLTLHTADFPSSVAFDAIQASLSASPADRKAAIKSGNGIFAFTLKNNGKEESWHIDLKESGTVGKGVAPEGKKPAVTLVLNDSEFQKLVAGKANAQKLFMSGKLKVKGDVMKVSS